MSVPEVHGIRERIDRIELQDGVFEITLGGIFVTTFGLPNLAIANVRADMPLSVLMYPVALLAFGLGGPFFIRVQRLLKERYVYPRTGYVQYRLPGPKLTRRSLILFGIAIFVLAAIAGSIASFYGATTQPTPSFRTPVWLPFSLGSLMAVSFLGIGYRFKAYRFYLSASFALAGGVLGSYLLQQSQGPGNAEIAIVFITSGSALLAGGTFTFWRYLKRTAAQHQPLGEPEG